MKLFTATLDTIKVTILAENIEEAQEVLLLKDKQYERVANTIVFRWTETFAEEVSIVEQPLKKGVLCINHF